MMIRRYHTYSGVISASVDLGCKTVLFFLLLLLLLLLLIIIIIIMYLSLRVQ